MDVSPNRILPIKSQARAGEDIQARLDKLEGSFLTSLQEIRSIKAELKKKADQSPTLEKLLDVKAVAELLGESDKWVYSRAKTGKIPSLRLGKYWKFSPSALKK